MSLWHKSPSEITFADIEEFCKTMQPEGARLDYKVTFPTDLAKTIAAFANTLGGLIILGVDADPKTNVPIWPSIRGMLAGPGLSERVVQIAQQAIYPPVRVGVSNVIDNANLPGHALVVVRVDESREAPHAVEKKREVYVYERVDNTSAPYRLAEIDRIEHLIKRRQRLVDQREAELQANLARAERRMCESVAPIRWMSVSPLHPWRDIHDPYACAAFHQGLPLILWRNARWRYQTFTGGSFAVGEQVLSQGNPPTCVCVSSVSSNGTLFCMAYTQETILNINARTMLGNVANNQPNHIWVDLHGFREMAGPVLTGANDFYKRSDSRPGELIISIGMKRSLGVFMQDSQSGRHSDAPFPDLEFRLDQIVDSQRILADRMTAITGMFDDIAFAFNANAIVR